MQGFYIKMILALGNIIQYINNINTGYRWPKHYLSCCLTPASCLYVDKIHITEQPQCLSISSSSWIWPLLIALCLFGNSHSKNPTFLSLQWPFGMSEPKHWSECLISRSQTIIKQTFYYLFDKNSERAFFWLLASLTVDRVVEIVKQNSKPPRWNPLWGTQRLSPV